MYHRNRVSAFYIYKCKELLDYVTDMELAYRIVCLMDCLRYSGLTDELLNDFWEFRDEAFSL